MNEYYAFVSGLPVLLFDDDKNAENPDEFLAKLKGILSADELEFALWIWLRKYHPGIVIFLSDQDQKGKLPPEFPTEKFDPEHETFIQMPEYLRNTIIWLRDYTGDISRRLTGQKLNEFYFHQLQHAESRFLKRWGEFEHNLLNFMASQRSAVSMEEKEQNLITGNEYYQILMRYSIDSKIVESEFFPSGKLVKISQTDNYLERERAIDRLRWEAIDKINRFQYFTTDVILGYFQKLLIRDRWNRIFNAQADIEPATLAEQMIHSSLFLQGTDRSL